MAGIAGIVYPDAFQVEYLVAPMIDTMSHRGTNGREEFTFKNMQVGICGGQLAQRDSLVVGLDGVIHNRKSLHAILQTKEDKRLSDDPSELILHAYRFWGNTFLEHIRGDFALFILDQKKEKLILARDRIGKKPLYWFQNQHYFIFASELKSILASGAVPQMPATDSIATYLYFGYLPHDLTPIKNINKLLPAHYLQLNRDRSKSIEPFWSFSAHFQQKAYEDKSTIVTHLDTILKDVVRELIPDTHPFGCFVSGGLGSASIAHYLRQNVLSDQFLAYTVAFQGENIQDLKAAEMITKSLQLEHKRLIITPQTFLEDWVKIAWYLDEPIADPNAVATWKMAELARPSKVVFSGMGSDELLAGHSRYSEAEREITYKNWIIQAAMPLIKQLLLPLLNIFSKRSTYGILKQSRTNPWQLDYLNQNAFFNDAVRGDAAPRIAELFDPHVFLHKFHNLPRISSKVSSFLYFDFKTRLVDCFILQFDRLMSANGLDWRTPFLSQAIVEYLAGLPEPDQLAESDTFFILKAILKDVFPESFISRPKKTRKDFLKPWVEISDLAELFLMLPKGAVVEAGLISEKWLRKQVATAENRRESFRYLWAILALEIWFRLYINRPIQPYPPQISVRELLLES